MTHSDHDGILPPHERDQIHSALRDNLDAIITVTRDQYALMVDMYPDDPATAEDVTLGWLMAEFDEGADPEGQNGLRLTRDDLACLAGFAIFRLITQDDQFIKLAAQFPGSGWLPNMRDLDVAVKAFNARVNAGIATTPREHCAAILNAIRKDRQAQVATPEATEGDSHAD